MDESGVNLDFLQLTLTDPFAGSLGTQVSLRGSPSVKLDKQKVQ